MKTVGQRRLHNAVDRRLCSGTFRRVRKQPPLAADHKAFHHTLAAVVVQLQPTIFHELGQLFPLIKAVADRQSE
jgi:hypothetical protein